MGEATTRDTRMKHYIRSIHRQIEHLPHEIDRIQARRALVGMKDELGVEYNVGDKIRKIKKIKKSLSHFIRLSDRQVEKK